MKTLYITENGLNLKKRSNRIAVKKDGKIIREFRTTDLKRILVFGNSQITTNLMRFLASKGIEAAFLSYNGRFQYRLVPELTKNVYLRTAQNDRYRDKEFRLNFSKSIIKGKVKNQRIFLIRYQRAQSRVAFNREIKMLKETINRIDGVETLDQIRGEEGNAGRIYFQCYGKLLLNDFEFKKREYHPPPDPVNAMLGFAYMLLFNEIGGLLEAFGFDVYVGFLHDLKYGRKSLASDLIEELRSPIADRLILHLINRGIIKKNQFTKQDQSVKMDNISRKRFLANYENFMVANFLDVKTRKQKNFRGIIRERVEELEDVVINDLNYSPFIVHS